MPSKKELAAMSVEDIANIQLPVCVRVTLQKEIKYLATGYHCSIEKFQAMCEEQFNADYNGSRKRTYMAERDEAIAAMERVKDIIVAVDAEYSHKINLQTVQDRFNGKQDEGQTLNDVLVEVIAQKRKEGKIGTSQSYECALRRFQEDMCKRKRNNREKEAKDREYIGMPFDRISNDFVKKWREKMLAQGVNETTAGIYLRCMRVIVNSCIERGQMQGDTKSLFKDARLSFTNKRTGEFLNADTMQRLYDFWLADEATGKDGKELFAPRDKRALFRDLGYFLFSYLGNGLNVANMADLTYNEHYHNSNDTELAFMRKKTGDRTNDKSFVIIPIDLTPVQALLARLANKPVAGGYVFPINKDGESEAVKEEHARKCNANIRKALSKLAPLAGLDATPTAAWARHSFATNLSNAGVPIKYIDSSMGHTDGKEVINFYLGGYPHGKRVEYNSLLLPMMKQQREREELSKKLSNAGLSLTDEQVARILEATQNK